VTERILITGFGGQGTILAGKLLCIAGHGREGKHISHIRLMERNEGRSFQLLCGRIG